MKPEDVRVGTRIVYCGRKLRVTSVRVVPRYIKGKPTDETVVVVRAGGDNIQLMREVETW